MDGASTLFSLESDVSGWRLRLRPTESGCEVRVLIRGEGSSTTLKRYLHLTPQAAILDLNKRFMELAMGDAERAWRDTQAAFGEMLRGRPGLRPRCQALQDRLNVAADRLARTRLVVARGLVEMTARSGELGVAMSALPSSGWLPSLVDDVNSEKSQCALVQRQLARISDSLFAQLSR